MARRAVCQVRVAAIKDCAGATAADAATVLPICVAEPKGSYAQQAPPVLDDGVRAMLIKTYRHFVSSTFADFTEAGEIIARSKAISFIPLI
jgi:hypothetical protein